MLLTGWFGEGSCVCLKLPQQLRSNLWSGALRGTPFSSPHYSSLSQKMERVNMIHLKMTPCVLRALQGHPVSLRKHQVLTKSFT